MAVTAASEPAAIPLRHSGNAATRGPLALGIACAAQGIATLISTPRCAAPLARSKGAALTILATITLFLACGQRTDAEVKFEVGGAVEAADETLDVRVDVTNNGDIAASALEVRGELGDEHDVVPMPEGVPAARTRSVMFRFTKVPPPGVHVLGLRLDYTEAATPARAAASTSQRAFLLLSLGTNPPPAVRVSAAESRLATRGAVPVALESADGAPHRVRVRVLTPRGLNADSPVEVDVPATGAARALVPVLRGNVPRPSRQGILVVAEVVETAVPHASVASTIIDVEAHPALLPRLRWWLGGLAVLLLAAAAVVEARSRRRDVAAAGIVGPDAAVRPSS